MDHVISSNIPSLGSPSGSPNSETIAFTDKGIRYLEATNKRRVVWARGIPGLGIRVTPKGTKSFVYKYDVDGQDRWLTLGQYPKLKLAEALAKYSEALEKVEAGEDPAEDRVMANQRARKALTVRQLAEEYIEKYAKPRKRSWAEDNRILEYDVLKKWGARRASKITRRDVVELLDEIVARGASVQANRTLAVVRRMFHFAEDRDLITTSPCHRLKPPSPESPKDRYLTLDEIALFWRGLNSAPMTAQTKAALRLLLLTLQRSSEVIGMNKSEINLRDATWIIPAARSKNKRSHLVPLSPPAVALVEERLEKAGDDGFLFSGEGQGDHLTKFAPARALARNLDHFGIPKFTPHDLRRTGSTQLAGFRVPRFDRDRVLNHTDQTIGAVYDVYEYQDEKRAVLNLWADIVLQCGQATGRVRASALKTALKYQDYFPS